MVQPLLSALILREVQNATRTYVLPLAVFIYSAEAKGYLPYSEHFFTGKHFGKGRKLRKLAEGVSSNHFSNGDQSRVPKAG